MSIFYEVKASAKNLQTEEYYTLIISSLNGNNEEFYKQADEIVHEIKKN